MEIINWSFRLRAEPLIGSTQARRSSHKKSNSLVDITPLLPTPVPVAPSSPGEISWTNRSAVKPPGVPKGFTLRGPNTVAAQTKQLPSVPMTAPSSPPNGTSYLTLRPSALNTRVEAPNNNNNRLLGTVDNAKKISNAGAGINYSSSMPSSNNIINSSYDNDMDERRSSGAHIPAPPEIAALNTTHIVNNNIQKFNAISSNSPKNTIVTSSTTSNIYPSGSSMSSPAMPIPNSASRIPQSSDIDVSSNSPWPTPQSQGQSNPKLGLGMTRTTGTGPASNTPNTPNNSYLRSYFN